MRSYVLQFGLILLVIASACQPKKDSDHNHDASTPLDATAPDTVKKSIPKEEHAQIGTAHLMIKYHAPAVRERVIWGGLVPYGEVWVTGAHSATSLEVDEALMIGDTQLAPGKFALFTIPDKDKWTVIINKNWDQHLADEYDQTDDVIRLVVNPEQLPDTQERLKFTINSSDDKSGTIEISWEKVKVKLPFKIS